MARKGERLTIRNFGPITNSDVEFGDLTVLVGPQATGKSIFLQTLKLVIDRAHILDTFSHHNVVFNGNYVAFLDGYFGKGMSDARTKDTEVSWCGTPQDLKEIAKPCKSKDRYEQLFYIPAQRVVSLRGGTTQNFGQFDFGDPYALRAFSDTVHDLVQNEFSAKEDLFPVPKRLSGALQEPISTHLFGGARLAIDLSDYTKRMVLRVGNNKKGLPFLGWSAGQREFTPLLLGLYWLCPAGGKNSTGRRRSGKKSDEDIRWVVIEEAEMGLHPQGISTLLLLVLELMKRGYRVVLSTHSPVILDMVWAIQIFKKKGGKETDIYSLFDQPASGHLRLLAKAALAKEYRVYFFGRGGVSQDISQLDPSSVSDAEANWGGLSGFASRAGDVVASVVNRFDFQPKATSVQKPRKADLA